VSVRAEKFISPDEDYFEDHFPGFPVVPGVLLTEMMGQAAGKSLDAEKVPRGKSMLAKIKSAVFREWVRPGSTVELLAEIKSSRPEFATASCQAKVQGKVVASAELFLTFVPINDFSPAYRDVILEEYLLKHPSSGK